MSFTATDFASLCAQGPVAEQIATIEERRRAAVAHFWRWLIPAVAASAALGWLVGTRVSLPFGIMLFIGGSVLGAIFASGPLSKASEGMKQATLEALAAQGGMSFTATGFQPPVFAEARRPLFGSWLSQATFTDLFYGTDAEGKRFAFYEGTLTQGHGKHRVQVFSGQIYAFERRGRDQAGEAVAVPDRGLFNFFKPSGGFDRVRIESDPAFEKKFEIYGTDPAEAQLLFGSMAARRLLLELRERGHVFLFVGPSDVLAAVAGGNRYEPGSMFSSKAGEARVRLMFDDVCGALDIVKRLRAALG